MIMYNPLHMYLWFDQYCFSDTHSFNVPQLLWSDFDNKHIYWETSFAILIAILGLVLFAHLIGNMQVWPKILKSCFIFNAQLLQSSFLHFHQYIHSILCRPICNLSLWDLRSGGSGGETQRSGWDIGNSLKICKNVLGDLCSTSGLQLEELMKNQSYMPCLQIFVEISNATYV